MEVAGFLPASDAFFLPEEKSFETVFGNGVIVKQPIERL